MPRSYLRPETAQGMFVNFVNVLQTDPQEAAVRHRPGRQELPQRDHAAELHLPHARVRADGDASSSCRPPNRTSGTTTGARSGFDWYVDLGIPEYDAAAARRTTPTSCRTTRPARPTSSSSSRGDGASSRASPSAPTTTSTSTPQHSGERLDFFDQATNERYVPYVIEPAAGVNRAMAAFLLAAYDEDVVNDEARTVLRLHPRLAPYKVAVLPLSKKDTLTPLAHEVRATARRSLHGRLRRDPGDRPSLPPPGRDRHAVVRHRRLRLARRRRRHGPRSRHHRAGAGADRRARDRRWPSGSASELQLRRRWRPISIASSSVTAPSPPTRRGRSTTCSSRLAQMAPTRGFRAALARLRAARRDQRDQAPLAVEGRPQPRSRPGADGQGLRSRRRRRACRCSPTRSSSAARSPTCRRRATACVAAGAAQGLHRVAVRRRRRAADGCRLRAADRVGDAHVHARRPARAGARARARRARRGPRRARARSGAEGRGHDDRRQPARPVHVRGRPRPGRADGEGDPRRRRQGRRVGRARRRRRPHAPRCRLRRDPGRRDARHGRRSALDDRGLRVRAPIARRPLGARTFSVDRRACCSVLFCSACS